MRYLVFMLLLIVPANAHDNWISHGKYKNPITGEHCCGDRDCPELKPEYVNITALGYYIPLTNETIPFKETYNSQDGKFYRCHKSDGSRRCFFAPVQTY